MARASNDFAGMRIAVARTVGGQRQHEAARARLYDPIVVQHKVAGRIPHPLRIRPSRAIIGGKPQVRTAKANFPLAGQSRDTLMTFLPPVFATTTAGSLQVRPGSSA